MLVKILVMLALLLAGIAALALMYHLQSFLQQLNFTHLMQKIVLFDAKEGLN